MRGPLASKPLTEVIGSSVTASKADLLSGVHAGEISTLLVARRAVLSRGLDGRRGAAGYRQACFG